MQGLDGHRFAEFGKATATQSLDGQGLAWQSGGKGRQWKAEDCVGYENLSIAVPEQRSDWHSNAGALDSRTKHSESGGRL
jgi:hypothetical protein